MAYSFRLEHTDRELCIRFNGLVPLAYGLNDQTLKHQVHEAATTVLQRQTEDGWIGPEQETESRNIWGR